MLPFDTLKRSPKKPEVTDSVAQLKDELTEARVDKQMTPADFFQGKHQKTDSTGHTCGPICFISIPWQDVQLDNYTRPWRENDARPTRSCLWLNQIMDLIKGSTVQHSSHWVCTVSWCNGPTEHLLRVNRICEPMSSHVRPRPRRMWNCGMSSTRPYQAEVARDCPGSLDCGMIEARKDNKGILRSQFARTDTNTSIQVRYSKWLCAGKGIGWWLEPLLAGVFFVYSMQLSDLFGMFLLHRFPQLQRQRSGMIRILAPLPVSGQCETSRPAYRSREAETTGWDGKKTDGFFRWFFVESLNSWDWFWYSIKILTKI